MNGALGPRVPIGSVWWVSNRSEIYPAEVTGFTADRVAIRRLCGNNVTATTTFALWSDFVNNFKPYQEGRPA